MARPAKINQRKYIKNKNSRRREVSWTSISFEKGKSLSDYPEEIIFNILVWLPAASLNDLRRVCKNWLDIISSSYFIQCHLARVQPYLIERHTTCHQIHSVDIKDSEIRARNLDMGRKWSILATSNGLLLIKNYIYVYDICISNPATKQLLRLPTCSQSPLYQLLHDLAHYYVGFDYDDLDFYRFGYAPSTSEYKVVHFFHDGKQQWCEILTVGSDSWRRIDISFLVIRPLLFNDQLLRNGVLYWVGGYDYIMSMDVAQETFHQTPIPSCIRLNCDIFSMDATFYLIRGYPSLINRISDVEFEVWILKDFQIKEWIKLQNIDMTARGLINLIPLPCMRNDEVIFQSREKRSGDLVLSTYDLKLQKMIQVKLYPREPQTLPKIRHFDVPKITHFDTLVSLKF